MKNKLDKILRVDHAGEVGAAKIYEGQLKVLGKTDVGPMIQHMKDQEKEHLDTFHDLLNEHEVRPTIMLPIWNLAGYGLGVISAAMGKKAAMACTIAVEEVIGKHYEKQANQLTEKKYQRMPTQKQIEEAKKRLQQAVEKTRQRQTAAMGSKKQTAAPAQQAVINPNIRRRIPNRRRTMVSKGGAVRKKK